MLLLLSCKKSTNIDNDIDKDLNRFSKLKNNQLTKIDFLKVIDLDTIDTDEKIIFLHIIYLQTMLSSIPKRGQFLLKNGFIFRFQ